MVVTTSLQGFFAKVFFAFSRIDRPNVVWTSVLLAFFALLACAYVSPTPAHAATGINQQINFQGRLLNQQGATVPDGYYNIQFKIYQDGDGLSVGNTTGSPAGSLLWTESHLNANSQGVVVKNGFLSVQLGSINAFGSQIDWNQDTLWLSMNIGDTNVSCSPFSSCTPDGEMVPMKRLTAVPYALNSRFLNGLASSNFVQLAQGVQADNSTASSIFINKTNTGNLLQFQNSGSDVFTVSNAGDLTFGANADHALSIATSPAGVAGKTLSITAGAGGSGTGSAGGDLVLSAGAAGGTDGNGGNLTINAGAKTGTGTDGTISLGTANTSAINLAQNTTVTGTLGVSSNVDTNGSLTVGNADQFVVSNLGVVTSGTWQAGVIDDTYVSDTLTVNSSSTVDWQALNNYPGACAAGSAVTQLGDTVTCSAFATGTASDYIQNQTAGAQTSASFWISGNGRLSGSLTADTSILTTTLDTASAASLNIGDATAPTATVINLNQNTALATGKSLTVNGDAFTDLTGSGLTLSGGALTVDASSSTGFFRNGGNSFGADGVLGTNDTNSLSLRTNGTNRATFDTTGTLYVGDGVTAASTGTFTIQGSTGAASNAGYNLSLLGGTGGSNSNGGDITLQGGAGAGTGVQGQVKLSAGGYATTTIAAYGTNQTISQTAVDNYSSIAISASAPGLTISVPAPTTKYDGRVLYIQLTGSNPITLSPSGGSSTSLAINSVYALVWNTALNGWLAAGTDSNGFIQNQNSANQTANFRISGVGQANSGFTGPSLDTVAASGTLTVGGTNATTINLGNSTAATAVTLQGGTSGTAISIQSGAAGTISVGTADAANTINIGSSSLSSGTQTITVGGANTAGGTQNVIVGSDSGATAGATTIQSKDNTTVKTNGTTRATFDTSNNLYLGNGVTAGTAGTFVIQATGGNAAGVNGSALTIQGGTGGATATGGALTLNAGAGGSANGALSLGTANTASIAIGAASITTTVNGHLTLATGQNLTINGDVLNDLTGSGLTISGSALTVDSTSSTGFFRNGGNSFSTTAVLGTNDANDLTLRTNGTTRATFDQSNNLYLGNGSTNASPNAFTIQATSNSGTGAGGALTIQAGNSGSAANGANLTLSGGTGGNGINGLVMLTTPTFQPYGSTQICSGSATTMTINQSSVDNFGTVRIGSSSSALCTISLPSPTSGGAAQVGRVIYITVVDPATSPSNFILSVNGGGPGNVVSMRANSSATMVWNGSAWAAAGASNSTTLQAAYDNTIQNSGGAELILSKTTATNGLTIRDSAGSSAVNGALFNLQTGSAANLLSVNSSVTEYASDAGAELYGASTSTFPSNTWTAYGTGASISRNTTTTNNTIATGQASVAITTSGGSSADTGAQNQIVDANGSPLALTANNHYNVSFSVRLPSNAATFTDLKVDYSKDGTTTVGSVFSCATGQKAAINVWTKINCSFTAPATGITSSNVIMIRQAGATARTFYVDNLSVTIAADYNLTTDGGADASGGIGNAGSAWDKATFGGSPAGTITQDSTGQAASTSVKYTSVPATAKVGIRNKLAINPLPNTLYRVTVYAKSSNSFSDFMVRYTPTAATANTSTDGNYVNCQDYNTRTISTTQWTKVTCYIKTGATTPDTSYLYFVQETGTARDFAVDTASITLSDSTTPNVQVGSGVNGGPTTLFTLDRGASAPIAGDNEALLGSMYYDTTLGKLQCYEADGWGACGSSPDNIITISPEYTNAVMHGTGVGTMTSDLCSDFLDINDATHGTSICGTNETYNFYNWTSPQASLQTYSIYVTYQLPNTFKAFASGSTSLQGRVSNTTNATIAYSVYRSPKAGGGSMTQCGTAVPVAASVGLGGPGPNVWETKVATGAADPSACGFTAGDSIIFKISLSSNSNANAYIGNIGFTFSNN